jgi:hypothetical protein
MGLFLKFVFSLARAEANAGAQELLWIDRVAVDAGFIMQMRAC